MRRSRLAVRTFLPPQRERMLGKWSGDGVSVAHSVGVALRSNARTIRGMRFGTDMPSETVRKSRALHPTRQVCGVHGQRAFLNQIVVRRRVPSRLAPLR